MPAPNTRDDLLELVRKSGVVPPHALAAYLDATPDLPAEARPAVTRMVQAKLVTPFQAKLLMAGRYRGFRLGAYVLLDQIGQGGMGAVYLAEHETLHRKAAIKVLPPGGDKLTVERFLREARAAAALDHPNIVRTHDVGKEGEVHFLVMEYVPGQTLDKMVAAGGPLAAQKAVEVVAQACAGLQHAHERGFVHRDVKPANLILATDGTVKILDMGLARSGAATDQLTQVLDAGAIVGTADYISPEQATNEPGVDIRSDIYSLGATFFAVVTGRPPFDGHTASKLLQHQVKDAPSVTSLDRTFPPGLSAVIARMMAKRPADRFGTPAEVIAALQPWHNESVKLVAGLSQTLAGQTGAIAKLTGQHKALAEEPATLPDIGPEPKRKKTPWALVAAVGGAAAALLLGVGVAVAMALGGGKQTDAKATGGAPAAPSQTTQPPSAAPATTTPTAALPLPPDPPVVKAFDPPAPPAPAVPPALYRLDLGTGEPVTVSFKTVMDAAGKSKVGRETDRVGRGRLPAGWATRSYMVDVEVEAEVSVVDAKPAFGLRVVAAPDPVKGGESGILIGPPFEGPTGYARLAFEYRTGSKTGKPTVKFKPEKAAAFEVAKMALSPNDWAKLDVVFDMKGSPTGSVEILPGGALGETFWVRNLVVTGATADELPKKR